MIEITGKFNSAKIFTDVVDEASIAQVLTLCNQEFTAGSRLRLMPDIHAGAGCTIGTTMTIRGQVVPNLVGVDIGCGMETIRIQDTRLELQKLDKLIYEKIPSGFNIRDRAHRYTDQIDLSDLCCAKHVHLLRAEKSIGTLGGGNHFIELQEDEEGLLSIMLHSGSRHVGKSVCDYFHQKARELNNRWYSQVPDSYRLAFLPVDTKEGQQYLNWMNLSMDFARENREKMLLAVKAVVEKWVGKYTDLTLTYREEINCHHNYAALEHHGTEDVWVHRKGAVRAREGELTVIPGAMGSYSYVVRGKGNPESFCSSSHGAGRAYSRKGAMEAFTCEQVMVDLKDQGVVLGKKNKQDVAEESRFAYKDIDQVMENQQDLVTPIRRLRTVGVVKG